MSWLLAAQLLLLGIASGFLAGLLGIGGGMLMVPFLTAMLLAQDVAEPMAVKMAIATSMACIVATSSSSLRAHHRRGAVRWELVRAMAPGIVGGGLLSGAALFALLKGQWLAGVFSAFVGYSALQMWRGKQPPPGRGIPGATAMSGVGALIGLLSGLVGAGGGFLAVPFLVWCNVAVHQAVATSAAIGLPVALASTLGYLIGGWELAPALPGAFGYLYLPALAVLTPVTVLFAPLGAKAAHALPVAQLKRLFALLLMLLAAYMASKAVLAAQPPSGIAARPTWLPPRRCACHSACCAASSRLAWLAEVCGKLATPSDTDSPRSPALESDDLLRALAAQLLHARVGGGQADAGKQDREMVGVEPAGGVHRPCVRAQEPAQGLEQALLRLAGSGQALGDVERHQHQRELAVLASRKIDLAFEQLVEQAELLQAGGLVATAALLQLAAQVLVLQLVLLDLCQRTLQMDFALPLLRAFGPDREQMLA